MASWYIACKVYAFGFLIDIMWVGCVTQVAAGNRVRASVYSMLLAAPALFGYVEVMQDRWMAVPYLLGLGSGTYVATGRGTSSGGPKRPPAEQPAASDSDPGT